MLDDNGPSNDEQPHDASIHEASSRIMVSTTLKLLLHWQRRRQHLGRLLPDLCKRPTLKPLILLLRQQSLSSRLIQTGINQLNPLHRSKRQTTLQPTRLLSTNRSLYATYLRQSSLCFLANLG